MSSKARKRNYVFIITTLCAVVFGYMYFFYKQQTFNAITSFEDCIRAGYKVNGTYPEECIMPGKKFPNPNQKEQPLGITSTSTVIVNDFKNNAYFIEGQTIVLTDGVGILPENELLKRSTTTISYTDKSFIFDINGDGIADTTFLLATAKGGSAILYYIATSLSLRSGYTGTNLLYIDQDILSPAFTYKDGYVVLEYTKSGSATKIVKSIKVKNGLLEDKI